MKFLLLTISVFLLLSCAGKNEGSVVYLEDDSGSFGLKKVKEICEDDVDGEVCREIYIKPVPVDREGPYEKEKKEVLLKLLSSPPAPVRTPDRVLKVYVLPFTDESGNFHAGGYFFMVVEDGEWILAPGAETKGTGRKILTPLKEERKDEGR